MSDVERCGKCGDDIPASLIELHMASCSGFYEEDEDPDAVAEIFERGPHGLTGQSDDEDEEGSGGLAVAPDPDDEFSKLVAGLDIEIPAPGDVVNVALLDELELSRRYNEVRQQLLEMGEMLTPKSQKARDLHSVRAAFLVEMQRRGMKE